jgi:hypothetical protein
MSVRDLASGALPGPAGLFYGFRFGDLFRSSDEHWEGTLGDDQVIEIRDKDTPVGPPGNQVCPCVLILVVARAPAQDGGRNRSRYARGGSRASRLEFYRKIEGALEVLRTGGAFDDACITTHFDLDLTGQRFRSFFVPNQAGQLLPYLNIERLHDFTAELRSHLGPFGTDRCLTLVFSPGFAFPGGFGGPSARTPILVDPVPGANPPRWTSSSYNVCYLTDGVTAEKIAHEMGHLGGLNHARDNFIHPDASGAPSGKTMPADQRRADDDLMGRDANPGSRLQPADGAKFREYTSRRKCCDINKPAGSSVG